MGLPWAIWLARRGIGLGGGDAAAGAAAVAHGPASTRFSLLRATFPLWGSIAVLLATRVPRTGAQSAAQPEEPGTRVRSGKPGAAGRLALAGRAAATAFGLASITFPVLRCASPVMDRARPSPRPGRFTFPRGACTKDATSSGVPPLFPTGAASPSNMINPLTASGSGVNRSDSSRTSNGWWSPRFSCKESPSRASIHAMSARFFSRIGRMRSGEKRNLSVPQAARLAPNLGLLPPSCLPTPTVYRTYGRNRAVRRPGGRAIR